MAVTLMIEKVSVQSRIGLVFVQLEVKWQTPVRIAGVLSQPDVTHHSFVIGHGCGVEEAIDDAEARAAAMLLQRPSSG